jgi:hypothetical protein
MAGKQENEMVAINPLGLGKSRVSVTHNTHMNPPHIEQTPTTEFIATFF